MRLRLFALALVIGGTAHGYELLRVNENPCARADPYLFWAGAAAPVSTAPLAEPYRGLANEARERWNLSLRRFRFRPGTGAPCVRDGVVAIAIGAAACDGRGFGDALAITRSVWRTDPDRPGELVDADVMFAAGSAVLRDDAAFLEVTMHELGHALGLDHSDACGRSGAGTLMKSVLIGPRLEAPQADDVEGADFIYPADSGDGTVPEGANSCAIAPPGETGAALPFLLVPLLLLVRRWWARGGPRRPATEPIDARPDLL